MPDESLLEETAPIHVRVARVGDAPAIAAVNVATWQAAYRGLIPQHVLDSMSVAEQRAKWESRLTGQSPRSAIYVAETQQAGTRLLIGYAMGGPERGGGAPYEAELYSLYVLPAFHRRGVGRRLVRELVTALRAAHCRSMLVWCIHGNPAAHFYTRLGGRYVRDGSFEIQGVPVHETAYGWDSLDALHSALRPRALPGDSRALPGE